MKLWQRLVVGIWGVVALSWLFTETEHCREAWLAYGLSLPVCPAGELRQTAEVWATGLRRGAEGRVAIEATAHYTPGDADEVLRAPVPRFRSIALALVDGKGAATPLPVVHWATEGDRRAASVRIPDVPDGDYRLRATYETAIGAGEVEVAVPLYAPARVHVITDRPLYEPGHTVRFRAVVLRARDLAPLDARPGAWVVTDPAGEVVLEEQAPAGAWGVVAGSFPLDRGAPTGAWRVAWRSAGATEAAAFTVQPFTLPRFRVDATADRAYYRAGDAPILRGAVLYSSGAPVTGAAVEVTWTVEGAWPPPREWQERLLPKRATAGPNGRFELALPRVPPDLQGTATLVAQLAAADPAGDRAAAVARVLLSADGIAAEAVTELGDGLVHGFNNRLYVRVTTPDGREVAGTRVRLARAWQPGDPGLDAVLDEDGVASVQLDPGPPVNVVIPAAPYRPPPRPPVVTRGEVRELLGDEGAPLADQLELDRWLPALAPCAKWRDDGGDDGGGGGDGGDAAAALLGLRVDASGAITAATAGATPLARCAVAAIAGRRLPPGAARVYSVAFTFRDPGLPALRAELEAVGDAPEGLDAELSALGRGARDCLPAAASGRLPRALAWRVRAGARDAELGPWLDDPGGDAEARPALACATARLAAARVRLAEAAAADAQGVARFTVEAAEAAEEAARPQPTTMLGYELTVTAPDLPGAPSTKLRVAPGTIPDLRLRVSPVLARPGDPIEAQLIRGPGFRGAPPKQLVLQHLRGRAELDVDAELRVRTSVPRDAEGWIELHAGGARALVYVKPARDLTVAIAPKRDRYRPGEQAELALTTRIGGAGGPAAVGLFGVDDSLAQLAPLPGAGDLARVQPKVETSAPAFGVLDGQALALGRIRGANAAAATVLRVTGVPQPPELDAVVTASASTAFDPIGELTDRFYAVHAELHAQVRRWEASAPPAEKMRPATLAGLWRRALEACERRGERVTDAYGRRLRLSRLPPDLLALTDPRAVVVVGTRLPEDVENWAAWVARERP